MTAPTDDDDAGMERPAGTGSNDEAAEWFIRLRDDRLSVHDRQRNMRWLKQSPTHVAELLRVQRLYRVLRSAQLDDLSPATSDSAARSNVIELGSQRTRPFESSARGRHFNSCRLAAAIACVVVSFLLGLMVKGAWLDRNIETGLGEWRVVALADGTQVRIGPASQLRLSFGDDHRTIRLLRGEARFSVAEDAARPFLVESEMIRVLAVGTAFRVERLGGKDVVAVTEGSVAVYRDGRDGGGVALAAGEQISVTRATRNQPVVKEKVNQNYELAWADGWLVYENKTIAELASEFNRRNRVQIVVSDPTIAARRMAFFRGSATDPELFVAALEADSDITIARDDPDVLRLELSSAATAPDAETSVLDAPSSVNSGPL